MLHFGQAVVASSSMQAHIAVVCGFLDNSHDHRSLTSKVCKQGSVSHYTIMPSMFASTKVAEPIGTASAQVMLIDLCTGCFHGA